MMSVNFGIIVVLVPNILKVILVSKSFNYYRFILLSSASETTAGISPTPALLSTNTYRDRKFTPSKDSPFLLGQKEKKKTKQPDS